MMRSSFSLVFLFFIFSRVAVATELVYTPVNPSFGGNPLNGNYLLNNASAQNSKKDPDSGKSPYSDSSSLDRFTDTLESRLLSQLLTDVGNGNDGTLVTDDYIVNIIDLDGQLTITITDAVTGEISEIVVVGLNPSN
ncbi:curli assembly protein CsgF [Microbulbifer sp. OS29]|uniref:Curli production assembly/transport component CsgF n=1 Tax=Microbulbifer okhotskensis TaxID=2926617 RepID=A0A9X2EQL2_9GAMM|nr:curli assembly protein CsgF [Microbulbifer okhotskensis]MCO1333858.1 curli assembly protein CsgF [Microbulbifer okhotskensis]